MCVCVCCVLCVCVCVCVCVCEISKYVVTRSMLNFLLFSVNVQCVRVLS